MAAGCVSSVTVEDASAIQSEIEGSVAFCDCGENGLPEAEAADLS